MGSQDVLPTLDATGALRTEVGVCNGHAGPDAGHHPLSHRIFPGETPLRTVCHRLHSRRDCDLLQWHRTVHILPLGLLQLSVMLLLRVKIELLGVLSSCAQLKNASLFLITILYRLGLYIKINVENLITAVEKPTQQYKLNSLYICRDSDHRRC